MPSRSATSQNFELSSDKPKSRYARFLLWRNRLLRSATFQKWAARLPISQSIARQRATDLHHILAGFVYSQTLSASYKLGLLECLKDRIATLDEIADHCDLRRTLRSPWSTPQRLLICCKKPVTSTGRLASLAPRYMEIRVCRACASSRPALSGHVRPCTSTSTQRMHLYEVTGRTSTVITATPPRQLDTASSWQIHNT